MDAHHPARIASLRSRLAAAVQARRVVLPAISVAVLPLLIAGVWIVLAWRTDPKIGGDVAALELGTRSAMRGDALLGAYSRFGWNHPGPAFFYWSAPFYALSGQAVGGLGLAAFALLVVCLVVSCALLVAVRGRTGALAFVLCVSWWHVAAGTDWYDNMWNPVTVIGLVIVTGVAVAAFAGGMAWALPIAVAGASAAVQTHIGTVPVVLAFVVTAAVALGARLRAEGRGLVPPVVVSTVVALLIWSPPLVEQFTESPGNLSLILRSDAAGSGAGHSLGSVLDVVVGMFTLGDTHLVSTALTSQGALPAASWWRVVWLLGLLGLLGAGAVHAARRRRWFECSLAASSLLAAVGLVVSLTTVEGEIKGYLVLSGIGVGLLAHLALVLLAGPELARRLGAEPTRRFAMAVAGVCVAVASATAIADRGAEVVARRPGVDGAVPALRVLDESLGGVDDVLVDVVDLEVWTIGLLVVDELERNGRTVHVTEPMLLWVDRDRLSDGCEESVVRLHRLEGAPDGAMALGPAAFIVTSVDPACAR